MVGSGSGLLLRQGAPPCLKMEGCGLQAVCGARGAVEEQDGQGEVPVMKGLFLILCFIMGFLQHNFF